MIATRTSVSTDTVLRNMSSDSISRSAMPNGIATAAPTDNRTSSPGFASLANRGDMIVGPMMSIMQRMITAQTG